ncbi:type II toxin-antitoxin system RelE/ParE family toxin [Candidatus Synechococcus calcipolaris G9]|uniref:Type II toxin-antitoxin system RelE/ParE family toxin n=1 Tax=Candidatus Synechococcus calcipolaris G9 TaxID=1497997 RepID=A0ABT6EZW6_9SYNE|nr:type II toxin-antitoxin system RelE/ParE family toxin [Candidatus Synechococcus calcipolaris]MDG2991146.1 type II toxin-antitoxin system RelE/ParE family toxin [Candidatus Synechococcus calcipolaris G9]
MSYSVEFTPEDLDSLGELTPTIQGRILRKIRWLSENFDDVTPQALSADLSGLFKLRVVDYRIIYSFGTEVQIITIHKIGHRRDVYKLRG